MKKMLNAIQIAVGILSFVCVVGFVDECERGGTILECAVKSLICFAVIGVDYLVYQLRNGGRI